MTEHLEDQAFRIWFNETRPSFTGSKLPNKALIRSTAYGQWVDLDQNIKNKYIQMIQKSKEHEITPENTENPNEWYYHPTTTKNIVHSPTKNIDLKTSSEYTPDSRHNESSNDTHSESSNDTYSESSNDTYSESSNDTYSESSNDSLDYQPSDFLFNFQEKSIWSTLTLEQKLLLNDKWTKELETYDGEYPIHFLLHIVFEYYNQPDYQRNTLFDIYKSAIKRSDIIKRKQGFPRIPYINIVCRLASNV